MKPLTASGQAAGSITLSSQGIFCEIPNDFLRKDSNGSAHQLLQRAGPVPGDGTGLKDVLSIHGMCPYTLIPILQPRESAPLAGGAGAVPEDVAKVRAGAGVHHLHAGHEGDAAILDLQHVLWVHRRPETGPP